MNRAKNLNSLKTFVIIILLLAVAVIHHLPVDGFLGTHILHRELFFFPIVMAALWYGLKASLITALAASLFYTHFFYHNIDSGKISLAVIGLQVAGFNLMALLTGWMVDRHRRQQRERDFLKETFGRYVSTEVRDEILSGRLSLKGELKEVTVLFADLRDFSQLAETIPPRDVVTVVNTYFQAMSEAIAAHNGLVIQFIGDEIEAVFGAPIALKHHAQNAIEAALEMRARLSRVNLELSQQGFPALRHGIGLHTGKVVAANIGSSQRLSYALVGDTVNIASRIQDLNKKFGTDILLSDAVYHKSNNEKIEMRQLKPVAVKGISSPLMLYSLP